MVPEQNGTKVIHKPNFSPFRSSAPFGNKSVVLTALDSAVPSVTILSTQSLLCLDFYADSMEVVSLPRRLDGPDNFDPGGEGVFLSCRQRDDFSYSILNRENWIRYFCLGDE